MLLLGYNKSMKSTTQVKRKEVTIMKKSFEDYMNDEFLDSDILNYWNEYCELNCYYEDVIHPMYEFEDLMGNSFSEIFPRLADNFTLDDRYFREDHFGISSYQTARDAVLTINISDMENFMIEHYPDDISDWLEEEE